MMVVSEEIDELRLELSARYLWPDSVTEKKVSIIDSLWDHDNVIAKLADLEAVWV